MVKNAGEPWNLTVLIVELCQSQIWNCFRASIFRVQQSSFGRPWLLILKSPWSTWAWARAQSAWQKTSRFAWKLHSEWWHTPRHVACGQATDDRRGQDAPVLPMRGRWSRLRHVWASGSKRFSSTKKRWSAPYFLLAKGKGYRFGDSQFQSQDNENASFRRFLNLRSHCHDSVTLSINLLFAVLLDC